MKGFPSVRDPGSIENLLLTIVPAGVPASADREFLSSRGFRREADGALLELLQFLGFIRTDGAPTTLWTACAGGGETAAILGKAVRRAYSDLFSGLPGGTAADGNVMMDFFRTATGASDPEAAYMVLTFRVLCDLSVFPPEETGEPAPVAAPVETPPAPAPPPPPPPPPPAVEEVSASCEEGAPPLIRLSIHIDVSGDSDPQIRELAHRLLRRHLEAGAQDSPKQ